MNIEDWIIDNIGKFTIVLFLIVCTMVMVCCYTESQKPGFELKKDEWTCAKESGRFVGKVYIIRCDQWNRK